MRQSRRKLLKSSAGAIAGVGFVTTASGKTNEGGVAPGEIGLEDEIKELSRTGEVEEIRELIEEHDLNASVSEENIHPSDDDDEVSSDAYMREDESSVSVTIIENWYDEGYYVSGTADVNDQRAYWAHRKNGARANDGITLYWDNNEITSRDGAACENTTSYTTVDSSKDGDDVIISCDEYRSQYVGADVDIDPDDERFIPDFTVNIGTNVVVTGNHPYISVEYCHRFTRTSSWIDLDFGYGGVGVSLNEDNNWKLDTSETDF